MCATLFTSSPILFLKYGRDLRMKSNTALGDRDHSIEDCKLMEGIKGNRKAVTWREEMSVSL